MCITKSKWIGLLWVVSSLPAVATSIEGYTAPMPPPLGPFLSSKPLLYYGEEPSTNRSRYTEVPPYPSQGYPNPYGSTPFYFGRERMPIPQMPAYPYPQGRGVQSPYYYPYNYPYNPAVTGYPQRGGNGKSHSLTGDGEEGQQPSHAPSPPVDRRERTESSLNMPPQPFVPYPYGGYYPVWPRY